MLLVLLATLFVSSLAQRPPSTSTCDYYAQIRYGANSNVTQFQLVQGIVTLAFGGVFNLSNVSSQITGILNPGSYNGLPVGLQPWFNGSIPSTNLNDQAVGVDWLDGGGLDPLYGYLSGATPNVMLPNTTNEYRLFNHFFSAFSHIFGCTEPPPSSPSEGPQLSLAYVHKYINLNYTDLAHLIDRLSRATVEYGFSEQNSQTLSTNLNSQSINCLLVEPNPDCAPYVNLTADGNGSGAAQSSPLPSISTEATVTISPSVTQTASPAATTSVHSSSGSTLSAGGIAGTVIGGVAVLPLGVGAILLLLRRRRKPRIDSSQLCLPPGGYGSPVSNNPHTSYTMSNNNYTASPQPPPHNSVLAEMESPHPREMESPHPGDQPEMSYIQGVERGGFRTGE